MLPAGDLFVESISRAGRGHHLSVPLHAVVGYESPTTDSAGRQLIFHQPDGVLGGQPGGVVSDEGHAVAFCVVSIRVCSLPEPASALVDVPIRTSNEASGERVSRSF